MSDQFSQSVIHEANAVLNKRRADREDAFVRRQSDLYRREPRLRILDHQIRNTINRAAATALQGGGNRETVRRAIDAVRQQHDALVNQRTELLAGLGQSADALDEIPFCPKCNDRGWRGRFMCSCLADLCRAEQVKQNTSMMNLRGQSFDQFRSDYYPFAFRRAMELLCNSCRAYAAGFGESMPVRDLLFTGGTGLGKTFLSVCIADEVRKKGFSVVYDSAIHIFERMELAKFQGDPDARADTDRFLNCDLLVLDDLGNEITGGFVQSALYQLINTRLLNERCTIISTNLSPNELEGRYSPQICSRILGEYQVRQFYGEDIRRKS